MPKPSAASRPPKLLPFLLAFLLVAATGAVEDWYGRFDYAGDAIAYLDMSKAIQHGDWSTALNPYWSIGYPLILAATRWLFASGPHGEWTSVHVVNLVIFLATYAGFLRFLKVAVSYVAKENGGDDEAGKNLEGLIFILGTTLFLFWQLGIGNVSRISPDLLVSCLFFLVTAESLRFFLQPTAKTALLLGLFMGLGYLVKAVFLPVSIIVLGIVFLRTVLKTGANRVSILGTLAWALLTMALIAVPYTAANSMALGKFTLGETGGLNYAWNVNHLPCWSHWQGGPEGSGAPLHPAKLALTNPPVFVFAEPYQVTYAPWYNPYWWYAGYQHSFSVKNQIEALRTNLSFLRRFFFPDPHFPIKMAAGFVAMALGLFLLNKRADWWRRVISLWPLILPSLAVIAMYLIVFIETRYVVAPLIILYLALLLPLFLPTPLLSRRASQGFVLFMILACAVILLIGKKDTIRDAIHRQSVTSDEQWQIGLYLAKTQVQPGDKVATVRIGDGMHCTWAHVGDVHIVGEIGNDAYDGDHQEQDMQLFTDHPDVQQNVFDLFRPSGAVLVLLLDPKNPPQGPGWLQVPETSSWFHRLDGK